MFDAAVSPSPAISSCFRSDDARASPHLHDSPDGLGQEPRPVAAVAEDDEETQEQDKQHSPPISERLSKPNVDRLGPVGNALDGTTTGDGDPNGAHTPPPRQPGGEMGTPAAVEAGTEPPGGGKRAAAAAATADVSLPLDVAKSPPPPPTAAAVRTPSPQKVAAPPLSPPPERRKRVGGEKEAPGQRRRRKGGRTLTPVGADGGVGNSRAGDNALQNQGVGGARLSPVAASSRGPGRGRFGRVCKGGGGEGVGGADQYAAALSVSRTGAYKRSRENVGEEEQVGDGRSGKEEDTLSAVVWYKTIVACLVTAAS